MEQSRLFYSIWNWFSPGSERGSRKKGDSVRAPAREAPAGWGATMDAGRDDRWMPVSIHAPARGATQAGDRQTRSRMRFNPRSRTGSDGQEQEADQPDQGFQSTLPHGERHRSRADQGRDIMVSIHAPARGATKRSDDHLASLTVSIHAPARGATLSRGERAGEQGFQSTLPHGERRAPCRSGSRGLAFQSTLPHGERQHCLRPTLAPCRFNPRSRTGSDRALSASRYPILCFNPRSRTGSDRKMLIRATKIRSFNPRSRTGSDSAPGQLRSGWQEFQSTLPHGERHVVFSHQGGGPEFQSTLPHGERRSRSIRSISIHPFQSTLPHGERLN